MKPHPNHLDRAFFDRPTLTVAEELLGKILVCGPYQGYITETEAYIGEDDPACHAARGLTPRTAVMFGAAGFSYVYLIYGMYYMLNIVTEREGFPAAVLIRGVQLLSPSPKNLNGPGKLCRELGITQAHNRVDMVSSPTLTVKDSNWKPTFRTTPRIGIKVGTDKLWRFVAESEKHL
jgi:DNA-3-methyladenine glycosylase